MEQLTDRVVVITGGASGIGLAIAHASAAQGARIVIADIEAPALRDAAAGLPDGTLATEVDVSDLASVEALRDAVLDRHGRVDVLCNNAGVSTFNLVQDQTIEDWRWVLGANLWGVIHGVHAFLPTLLAQGTPSHIVNTASVAGLASGIAFLGPYAVSKVGVVSISETLRQELAGTPVGVSVLCPGSTDTKILESERNRPSSLGVEQRTPTAEAWRRGIEQSFTGPNGLTADVVAALVLDAVRVGRFWVLPHGDMAPGLRRRFDEILSELPA